MAANQGTLSKDDVFPGAILWLDRNADVADNITYNRSELTGDALDHPVLVLDTLRPDHGFLWICIMTGTYNYHAGDVPIAYSLFDGRKCEAPDCLPCGKPHVYDFAKPNNMLYHEEVSAKMCKPTHVRATKVYEVSIKMLRLERSQRSVSGWTLDSRSISEVLRMSATERDRLARRAYPVRNWPVAHTIDSNQPSPPYPGSDFNHNAGTYTGLLVESKVVKGGLESVPANTTTPSLPTATTSAENLVNKASFPPVIVTPATKPTTAAGTGAKNDVKGASLKPPTANISTPDSASQLLPASGVAPSIANAGEARRGCAAGVLTNPSDPLSALSCVSIERTTPSPSKSSSATATRAATPSGLKVPVVKLDSTPAGASATQKDPADDPLTKKVAAVDDRRPIDQHRTVERARSRCRRRRGISGNRKGQGDGALRTRCFGVLTEEQSWVRVRKAYSKQ